MVPDGPPGPRTGARRAVTFVARNVPTPWTPLPLPPTASPSSGWSAAGSSPGCRTRPRSRWVSRCGCSPPRPDDPAALVVRRRASSGARRPRRAARPSPAAARSSPSTTRACRASCCGCLVAEGVDRAARAGRPAARPGQARDARAARRCSARPCRAFVEVADAADVEGLRRRDRLAGGAQGRPRRVRRPRACGCSTSPTPGWSPQLLGTRDAADGRAGGGDAPRAGRAGRPLAVRAGGGVAGGRDRAARRAVRRGPRARTRPGPGDGRGGPAAGPADRRAARRHRACSPSSCSTRRHRGRPGGQRARDAAAQLRALDDRGRPHVAVRAAPACGARLPARRHARRPPRWW